MVNPADKGVYCDKVVLQTIIFVCGEQTKCGKPMAANDFITCSEQCRKLDPMVEYLSIHVFLVETNTFYT